MVRHGHVLTAPHFVCKSGPGSKVEPKLLKDWTDFDMASALTAALGKPARVANDADVQGLAVITGNGFEAVITLGTGFGSAFFMDRNLLPHMEFAHVEFRKGETFNDPARRGHPQGDRRQALEQAGAEGHRLPGHPDYLRPPLHRRRQRARVNRSELGEVLERVTVVDNTAGILGGIKLWEDQHLTV